MSRAGAGSRSCGSTASSCPGHSPRCGWGAQVIALRAAATGAGIVVETGRAPAWTGLARAVPGLPGAARRMDSGAPTPPTPLIDDGRYEVEAVRNLAMIACI
ncbi:hypothetical protein GT025_26190 [Streptomyces sp. SID4920]|nr:hypothetical protein [Streptomyces sp. SID4920]MYX65805.1 hypothetical protein [Streptomyces sp. SID8373]